MMKKIKITFLMILVSAFTFSQEKDIFEIARHGTLPELQEVLKKDANRVNDVNKNGNSLLVLACYYKNEAVASFLINQVKDINFVSSEGTALMACIVKGNLTISKLLLEKGANPNLSNLVGTTALMYAVQFQNIEAVKLLLQYKANKELKDNEGKTAFEFAVFTNNEQIINLLKN